MREDQPSATAYRVALRRAAHQILDEPRVLEDPVALRIVGARAEAAIRAEPRRYQSGFGRALRWFLAARSRCAEDALAAAVATGVAQYVILGAGLDTFAYRNPHPLRGRCASSKWTSRRPRRGSESGSRPPVSRCPRH